MRSAESNHARLSINRRVKLAVGEVADVDRQDEALGRTLCLYFVVGAVGRNISSGPLLAGMTVEHEAAGVGCVGEQSRDMA